MWDCYRAFKEESLGVCETSVSGACGERNEGIWEMVASRVNTPFFLLETESDSKSPEQP